MSTEGDTNFSEVSAVWSQLKRSPDDDAYFGLSPPPSSLIPGLFLLYHFTVSLFSSLGRSASAKLLKGYSHHADVTDHTGLQVLGRFSRCQATTYQR